MLVGTREDTAETIQSAGMRCSRKKRLPTNTQKTMKVHFTVLYRNIAAFFTVAVGQMPLWLCLVWQPLGESNSSCLDENQMS